MAIDSYDTGGEGGEGGEGSPSMPNAPRDMEALQRKWLAIIERYERKSASWRKRADAIVKIYADSDAEGSMSRMDRKYAVLWANVQTLGPATYARNPKCVVSRRFGTANQDVRLAVQALERATNLAKDDGHQHAAIMHARQDRLLAGRGTVWHYYEQEDDGQQITSQRVCTDYVAYDDFGHGQGRVWEELDAVWRKTYMGDEELKKRFGPDVMERCTVNLDFVEKGEAESEAQATIYEIWCKSKKETYWVAKSAKACLEAGPPPLDLKGFWPCPKPVYGTLNGKDLLPTPDYVYYQDQAREITKLTRRIDKLTDSLKLVGFYPKGPANEGALEIERALKPNVENVMIPVPSWAAFSEKGGASAIQWLPIDQVIKVLQACVEARKQLIQDVYQITGISDIMRGETNASETLGAQQLKSQYGSNRIRDTKDDFIRFAKESCEIVAEIVAEHFTEQTLGQMTSMNPYMMQPQQMGLPLGGPQQPQQAPQQPMMGPDGQPVKAPWVQLLRNQFVRDVLIDVETDSTIQPDEDAEKQRRIEFATVMQIAMAPLLTINTLDPQVAKAVLPMIGDGITFVARGFRAGRELEERIEETMQELVDIVGQRAQAAQQAAMQPQQPPPDPRAMVAAEKVKVDSQLGNRKLDIEAAKVGLDHRKLAVDTHKAVVDGQAKLIAANRPPPQRPGFPPAAAH